MSKRQESFSLDVPADQAELACRQVIAETGVRVLEDEERRFVIKELLDVSSTSWPVKVELLIEEEGLNSTRIQMNGSIWSWGPIPKRALRSDMDSLREMIKAVAEGGGLGSGALSNELERLAALRDKGILTEDEFSQAKARLLGT